MNPNILGIVIISLKYSGFLKSTTLLSQLVPYQELPEQITQFSGIFLIFLLQLSW